MGGLDITFDLAQLFDHLRGLGRFIQRHVRVKESQTCPAVFGEQVRAVEARRTAALHTFHHPAQTGLGHHDAAGVIRQQVVHLLAKRSLHQLKILMDGRLDMFYRG